MGAADSRPARGAARLLSARRHRHCRTPLRRGAPAEPIPRTGHRRRGAALVLALRSRSEHHPARALPCARNDGGALCDRHADYREVEDRRGVFATLKAPFQKLDVAGFTPLIHLSNHSRFRSIASLMNFGSCNPCGCRG